MATMARNRKGRGASAPKLSLHFNEQLSPDSFLTLLMMYVEGKISADELLRSKPETRNMQPESESPELSPASTDSQDHDQQHEEDHEDAGADADVDSPVEDSPVEDTLPESPVDRCLMTPDSSVAGLEGTPDGSISQNSAISEVGHSRETFGGGSSSSSSMSALAALLPYARDSVSQAHRISKVDFDADYPDMIPDSPAFSSTDSSPITPGPHPDMIVHEIEAPSRRLSQDQDFDPVWSSARKVSVLPTSGLSNLGVIQEDEPLWPTAPQSHVSDTDTPNTTRLRPPPTSLDSEHGRPVRTMSSGNTWRRSTDPRATWYATGGQFPEKRTLTPVTLSVPRPGFRHGRSSSLPSLKVATRAEGTLARLKKMQGSRSLDLSGPGAKSEPVFGVSLAESMRVAKMRVKISHRGRGDSFRLYPPSVYKCCEFIQRKGLQERNVFANQGDGFAVAMLKDIFSTGPDYGESFDFEGTDFTVFDAGSLMVHFLDSLPEPLVPASVAKKWVLLARQAGAIEPPAPRVEQGLDFWVEAFHSLPMANCHLIKHLLNLFALLSTVSGTLSPIEAYKIASAVSRGLFHPRGSSAGSRSSELSFGFKRRSKVLDEGGLLVAPKALVFLIQERAKYLDEIRVTANQRDSIGFTPSTREIMRWKGS